MRYRTLDANGDYTFGKRNGEFLINSPDAVAQAVLTRLRLVTGEWFLDVTDGTPYATKILGTGTQWTYDLAIRERMLGTQGVTEIVKYSSTRDPNTRKLSVQATLNTLFGQTPLQAVL